MVEQRHYSRAPITEAVIDVRLGFDGISHHCPAIADLDDLGNSFRDAYPSKRMLWAVQANIEADADGNSTVNREAIGISRRTADARQIVQLRRDGFTFSRLKPYENWDRFRDEARRLWSSYRETVFPAQVKRIAVRYINRFDLPLERSELKDYFNFYAEYPSELPQRMLDFLVRVTIPLDDISAAAHLTQALGPLEQLDVASIVFDIDVYREVDVPQSEEAIWGYFETLRVKKNELFESCILQPARELIGP